MTTQKILKFIADARHRFERESNAEARDVVLSVVSKQRQASPVCAYEIDGTTTSRWARLLFFECDLLTKNGRAAEVPPLLEEHMMPDGLFVRHPHSCCPSMWARAKLELREAADVYEALHPQIAQGGLYEGDAYLSLYTGMAAMALGRDEEARHLIAPLVQPGAALFKLPRAQKVYSRLLINDRAYGEHANHFMVVRICEGSLANWARANAGFLGELAMSLSHEKRYIEEADVLRPVLIEGGVHRKNFTLQHKFGKVLLRCGANEEAASHLLDLIRSSDEVEVPRKVINVCCRALINLGRSGEAVGILDPMVKNMNDCGVDSIESQHLFVRAHAYDITKGKRNGSQGPSEQAVVQQLLRINNRLTHMRKFCLPLEDNADHTALVREVATMLFGRTRHLSKPGRPVGFTDLRKTYGVNSHEGTANLALWLPQCDSLR